MPRKIYVFLVKLTILFFQRICPGQDFNLEEIFTNIYENHFWPSNYSIQPGYGTSGIGSQVEYNLEFIGYLGQILSNYEIKTVLDLGCGDWGFSKYINWGEVDYLGVDVVKKVINFNKEKFQSKKVKFTHGNFLEMDLPNADLIICKDVLIHLSFSQILRFLEIIKSYPYTLIVNDLTAPGYFNKDIVPGNFRPINLEEDPFYLKIKSRIIFEYHGICKEALIIEN